MWPAVETLIPSIGLLFMLYLVLKYMMEGDRRERIAQAKWDQEHAASNQVAPEDAKSVEKN
ncbi:lysyl-tRNA synthetase [Dermatophilaceae bacterium Sec6.4]